MILVLDNNYEAIIKIVIIKKANGGVAIHCAWLWQCLQQIQL
jgi:hypothetical protein